MWELNRMSSDAYVNVDKIPIVLILDDIRSLENVGSFFRTADAFRIEHIVLCGITPKPPHKEIHKTALGATESVSWIYEPEVSKAVNYWRERGYDIGVIEQAVNTIPLQKVKKMRFSKVAMVFGNEVNGVKQYLVDQANFVIEIPQFGTKHSLNVGVCAGIVLWEISQKLNPELYY